jgi:hypothetical protein
MCSEETCLEYTRRLQKLVIDSYFKKIIGGENDVTGHKIT